MMHGNEQNSLSYSMFSYAKKHNYGNGIFWAESDIKYGEKIYFLFLFLVYIQANWYFLRRD